MRSYCSQAEEAVCCLADAEGGDNNATTTIKLGGIQEMALLLPRCAQQPKRAGRLVVGRSGMECMPLPSCVLLLTPARTTPPSTLSLHARNARTLTPLTRSIVQHSERPPSPTRPTP